MWDHNPNNALSSFHTAICAQTGGGKGVAGENLVFNMRYPLVMFDPYKEIKNSFAGKKCHIYETWSNFNKYFFDAWMSGKQFVMAYQPRGLLDDEMERFSKLIWNARDGKRALNLYYLEFGKCVKGGSETLDKWTEHIATGGRKFALRPAYDFQRSTMVSKLLWQCCGIKIFGTQSELNDIDRVMKATGCTKAEIADIAKLNKALAVKNPNFDDDILKVKMHYIKTTGVNDYELASVIVPPNRKYMKKWNVEQKKIHESSPYKLQN